VTDVPHHLAHRTLRDRDRHDGAHSARIWNYWLGGKDNYTVDRAAGDQFSAIYPGIVDIARADRAFLGRVVRFLAGQPGSGNSWTSAPGCRPPTTHTRWPGGGPGSTDRVRRQ